MRNLSSIALFLLSSLVGFGAGAASSPRDPVTRAVEAMGGENALRQVRTVVMNARAQHWEPQSNYQAGGDTRPTGDSNRRQDCRPG